MRAVLCRDYGPPEALTIEDLPDPQPGPGEVVIDVAVAALNFFDTLIIANKYQFKPPLPFSPGAECAGRIAAIGEAVHGFTLGERVVASLGWGACRSKVVAPAVKVTPIPDALSDEAAAGLTVTYGTSLHALKDRARLQPGESLAVLGAAGGVGIAAVEIGAALGARVIACASSPDKLAFAKAHGAAEGLDYSALALKDGLKQLTHGRGVDVIYDPVGGALSQDALRAIAWKGRFLVVGFAAGEIPSIPLNLVLLKGCDVQGVFWGAFAEKEPEAAAANAALLVEWAASGRIRAPVGTVMALERTGEAIRLLADRKATGKILVRP